MSEKPSMKEINEVLEDWFYPSLRNLISRMEVLEKKVDNFVVRLDNIKSVEIKLK